MTGGAAGVSIAELALVLGLIAAVALGAPSLPKLSFQGRSAAAARHLSAELEAVRWMAVASGRSHGLLFERDAAGWSWRRVVDGNGNGIRRSEVARGTDRVLGGPRRLAQRVAGTRLGFPGPGPFPRIPPARGSLTDVEDPVRFGSGDLVSFSPRGSGSSGTLYLTGARDELYAVVLYGRTARRTIRRFDARSNQWKP